MELKAIRNAADIKKVTGLFMRVFSEPPYEEQWTEELVLKRLSEIHDGGEGFCFYAEEDGAAVGLLFSHVQTWQDGVHIIVEDLAVDPACRRKGVGRALAGKLEETARAKGMASIDLLAHTAAFGIDFWKSQGFTPTGYIQLMKRLR